jgi:NarL family two-component system response regulator LiaR
LDNMVTDDKKKVRVLIVDDHAVVREGLAFLASVSEDLEIVGQAEDGVKGVELFERLAPDVTVLDLVMPRMDGIEAIKAIKERDPKARILVLTSFSEEDRVFAAIKAGASGYLLKDAPPKELIKAILDVHKGEAPLNPSIAKKLIRELKYAAQTPGPVDPLTEREIEVLKLIASGLTNQEIAKKLFVSIRTVGVHVHNILDKLHLANRTQAALYALREGLAKLESDD